MGLLSPNTSDEFEQHFVDCGVCQNEIEMTQGMIQALRLNADIIRLPTFANWLRSGIRLWQPWAAASAIAAFFVAFLFPIKTTSTAPPTPAVIETVALDANRTSETPVLAFLPGEEWKYIELGGQNEHRLSRITLHDPEGKICWRLDGGSEGILLAVHRDWLVRESYIFVVSQQNADGVWEDRHTLPFRVDH